MKIILLGAGRVGYSVAESLVSERNDITVIDTNAQRLRELQERFDLRCVLGNGIDAKVLSEAGARDTDLLIACAAQDETNLVCCKIAHMLYNIPTRIARVRSSGFEVEQPLMGPEGFAVDAIICPEASLTRYISKLIEFPASLQVRSFAGGRACLASVRARLGAQGTGLTIEALRTHIPQLHLRVVAIYRRFADGPDRFVRCDGRTRIEPGDEVFVIAGREHLKEILKVFYNAPGMPARVVRRIMIAGGSLVGQRLAQELASEAKGFQIKLLESNAELCQTLAAQLPPEVLVLHGSLGDEDLLMEEHIEDIDFFLALGDDDENNIMASLLAKNLGAKRVIAIVNRSSYVDLLEGNKIDIVVSPHLVTIGSILAHIRRGDVVAVHPLRRGTAEAIEVVAHGDPQTSALVGRRVSEVKWPQGCHFAALVRDDEVIMGHKEDAVMADGDHLIFFVSRRRVLRELEKLIQVKMGFFG